MTGPELFDELDALGGTSDIVAKSLLELGCLGEPKHCGSCPLAIYASRLWGSPVDVCGLMVPATARVETAVIGDFICELPPACYKFASRFDDGEFPDLEM